MNKDVNFLLSSYFFDLPEERIAQQPAEKRDGSRLLVYGKKKKDICDAEFKNIADYLPRGSEGQYPLLIANNSKVLPARLLGRSEQMGKREFLLLSPLPLLEIEKSHTDIWEYQALADVLLKPSKNAKVGDIWTFDGNLGVEVLEKYDFGKNKVLLHWSCKDAISTLVEDEKSKAFEALSMLFSKHGHLPLPPYIKRNLANKPESNSQEESNKSQESQDFVRYQTIYAKEEKLGSVAAPTAGLHFTEELKEKLIGLGCLWEEVTLHVGYGTFTPVRTEDIREHAMHSEYFELSDKVAQAVLQAKKEGRPIIAVGTTSCRVLEGAARIWSERGKNPDEILPRDGLSASTNIFIYPREEESPFLVIDGIITNFHLPESSLLMLISALTGREEILKVYNYAIQKEYRFFSYGDAMLIY